MPKDDLPCIVVAGMGRCGTSLVMQMLFAAGVPCIGEWPAFETDASSIDGFDAEAFGSLRGTAIKLLDPFRLPPVPLERHIVIWLDRDPREQAKSQIKFLRNYVADTIPANRATQRAFVAGLKRDREKNIAALYALPSQLCFVTFETLIERPDKAAGLLVSFVGRHGWGPIDVDTMTSCVRPRSRRCHPGMLEETLIAEKERIAGWNR